MKIEFKKGDYTNGIYSKIRTAMKKLNLEEVVECEDPCFEFIPLLEQIAAKNFTIEIKVKK